MTSKALFVALVILVLGTVVPFMRRDPLMPEMITEHGAVIDYQIHLTMWITGFIFAAAQLVLGYLLWKYAGGKNSGRKATYIHGNNLVEFGSIGGSLVLFLGLNLMGQGVWAEMHLQEKPAGEGVVDVEANGMSFKWLMRYPGLDATFGRRDPKIAEAQPTNLLGMDWEHDPDAHDDVIAGKLVLPYGRDVVVRTRSRDVIHSFFVRELRVKQDAVPGLEVRIPFRIKKEGMAKFELPAGKEAAVASGDLNQLREDFRQHGIELPQDAELVSAGRRLVADFAALAYTVDDQEKARLEKKLEGTWYVSFKTKGHYFKEPTFNSLYSIESENGKLTVYKAGFEVICAELCGQGHWEMRADLEVVSPDYYEEWLAGLSKYNASFYE